MSETPGRYSKEQVLDLQKKIAELLEQQEFCLFFPNDNGRGLHAMICSENPLGAVGSIRTFLDKRFPRK